MMLSAFHIKFDDNKIRYLPGPVDLQLQSKNSAGGGSPQGRKKRVVQGAAPPGSILVFRMLHILVDATA